MKDSSALRRRSVLCAALLLAALLPSTSQPASACPMPPTLAEMTEQSSIVFVGKVASHSTKPMWTDEGEEYQMPVAAIRVETAVKGDVAPGVTVSVENFYPGYDEEGERPTLDSRILLVFATAGATPVDLSLVDVRDVTSQAARESYVARTREMIEILSVADQSERRAKAVEWSIRCIEDGATREDGVRDLSRSRYIYDEERGEGSEIALERPQLERIVSVVLATSDFESSGDFALAHVAIGLGDERVVAHLTARLRAAAERSNETTRQLMYTLAYGSEWYDGGEMVAGFDPEAPVDARRAFVEQFLDMLAQRSALSPMSEAVEIDE